MMTISQKLVDVIASEIVRPIGHAADYDWKVGRVAWSRLGTGFDRDQYSDLALQNIALRDHLSARWAEADSVEKLRLATWIIRDWGGIRSNDPETISSYVAMAAEDSPITPYKGVSSYSKVLSMRDPQRFAIYDSRVAASLNAIQLIYGPQTGAGGLTLFRCPPSRNTEVKIFRANYTNRVLEKEFGFSTIPEELTYATFLLLIDAIQKQTGLTILRIEMNLFARSERLCRQAAPVATLGAKVQ